MLVVIFTVARLYKILLPYKEERQLSYFDINLFYSFFSAQQKRLSKATQEDNKSKAKFLERKAIILPKISSKSRSNELKKETPEINVVAPVTE